ncbi:hypothetical protein TNCV_1245891 [Trichonephila clavipes]|uniref:Uncharacterized protein n=1 Tax=Trichonephila clavipes TaxID=2585209 RepID=A0A8X6REP6_TRICX|nr:hypothetical protein TNCV_1245891 [Trichonephila clavipes]
MIENTAFCKIKTGELAECIGGQQDPNPYRYSSAGRSLNRHCFRKEEKDPISPQNITIVRVHYFVRGGFVGHRSRASSKHLSPHLPVGSLDSSGGSNRGCAASEAARVGVESTKKPTPDVVVFET